KAPGEASGGVSAASSPAKSVSIAMPGRPWLSKSLLFTIRASLCRVDHHSPVRLLALRLAALAGRGHCVVHDLPLERRHGGQGLRLAGARDLLGHALAVVRQLGTTAGPVAADVEHQPGPVTGLPVHGE